MRRLLALSVVLVLVAGGVASAAGKQSRVDRQVPRYGSDPSAGASVQIQASIEGQLWMFLGHRGGDGFWLHAVPLLSADITDQLRSIYDGPDPTTSYSDKIEKADQGDEYDTLGGGVQAGGGVSVQPKIGGTGGSSDDD